MKITAIRARNINSLEKVDIDFEEFLGGQTLFAITGDTGSGKSTLLDIICCALYNRTPRLEKKTEELLQRGKSDGFCEVEFEVDGQRFRAKWSIKRGKNATKKMELAKLPSGEIIEEKVSRVPEAVAAIVHLDFEQFTRSLLLAQGATEAFLQANQKERSAILEKMTDIGIYRAISQRVYEKYKQMQKIYDEKRAVLDAIELLDNKQKESLHTRVIKYRRWVERLKKSAHKCQEALDWYEKKKILEQKRADAKRALRHAKEALVHHKADFTRLESAKRARAIEKEYILWQQNIKQIQNLSSEKERLQSAIQHNQERLATLKMRVQKKEQVLKNFIHFFDEQMQKIQKARDLDKDIAHQRQSLEHLQKELHIQEKESQELKEQKEKLQQQIHKDKEELEKTQKYIAQHQKDCDIQKYLVTLQRDSQRLEYLQKKIKELAIKRSALLEQQKELKAKKVQKEKEFNNIQKELSEKAKKLFALESKIESEDETSLQNSLQEIVKKEQLQKEQKFLQKQKSCLEQRVQRVAKRLEEKVVAYETARFANERSKLKEGEPCPLCGATHHPYAKMPQQHSSLKILQHHIQKLQRLQSDLQTKLGAVEGKLELIRKEIATIDSLDMTKEQIEQKLGVLQKLQKEKQDVQQKQEELQEKVEHVGKEMDEVEKNLALVQRDIAHTNEDLQAKEDEKKQFETLLQDILLRFGFKEPSKENIELLEKRNTLFMQKEERKRALDTQIVTKKQELQNIEHNLSKSTSHQASLQEQIESLSSSLDTLIAAREKVLQRADLDIYEEELKKEKEQHTQDIQHLSNNVISLETAIQKDQERVEEIKRQLQSKISNNAQELFFTRLKEQGFEDVDAFKKALISKERQEALEQKLQRLQRAFQEACGDFKRSVKELYRHLFSKEICYSLEVAQEKLTKIEALIDKMQQKMGAMQERLQENIKKEQEYKIKMQEFTKIQTEYKTAEFLNSLIGSAEGDKFAKYAQLVTLQRLLFLANRKLRALSDRYSFMMQEDGGLDFDIVDHYQADAIRPVRTLSGGERFLASLALALALSELNSASIKIDSLFLDEGFGTLDEDTLFVALEALDRLQQKGKIIGVISHLKEIKEYIHKQIRLKKRGGGISEIELVY